MKDYKNLIVWQTVMELIAEVYHLIKKLPKRKHFTLSNQIRISAVSIPRNIS